MIVIDDNFIRHRVLATASILNRFPSMLKFRERMQKLDAVCQTCGGRESGRNQLRELMNEIKLDLSRFSPEDAVAFKAALGLGAKSVTIPFKIAGRIDSVNI